MEPKKRIKVEPLPIEKEFKVLSIKQRLSQLSREELEDFLTESLRLITVMAHQLEQIRGHVELEG